jgi:RNA polymerase sigma factor (sigma-70 family)
MIDNHSDPQLVEACLSGDAAAWNQLVERYGRLVYSIAVRSGLTPTDADDAFQTVFTILFKKLGECRQRERLGAWLTTITRREVWRISRARGALADVEGDDALLAHPSAEPLPERVLESLEEQNLLRQALARLGDRCRQLLQRLYMDAEPVPYAEISRQFAMPEGSIGPTRARCLERLRTVLAGMGWE